MPKILVSVTNRVATLLSDYSKVKLMPYWSYSVPGYQYMMSRFPGWDGRIKMLQRDRLPAGLFWATYKEIEKEQGIRFKIKRKTDPLVQRRVDRVESDEKYKFQNECVEKMVDAANKGGGLILNATGTGKTRTTAKFFERMAGSALFVVDQLDLLEQAKKEIEDHLGEKVGYVGNSVFKPRRVTVATVQTLHRHRRDPRFIEWTERLSVVVIDEIHVQMSRRNFDVVKNIRPLAVFGLTATLQLKQKPVRVRAWSLAGPICYEYPLVKGMKEGVLSKGVVVRVLYENIELGPFSSHNEKYEEMIVDNAERNHITSRIAKYAWKKGMYVILIVERIKHMETLSRYLKKVPHKMVAGTVKGEHMEVAQRMLAKRKFEKGKVRLIITNKVFKKGVDIKRVDVIISASGLKSKNDAVQVFGRGVRRHEDKRGLLFFDIADLDPRRDEIRRYNRDRKKKKKMNSFHRASESRKRAFQAAGIRVKDFAWDEDGETKELFNVAKRALNKELKRK